MPDRRRFAIVVTPLLALLAVAAAVLLPAGAAPAAAQSTEPAVVCFEITVGWRICVAPAPEPPPPCQGIACIEPAPGAFEQRTFATGARIDWTHGIFVLDPETGETEGYRLSVVADNGIHLYESLPGGWIRVGAEIGTEQFRFLLHRATDQTWRWPAGWPWLLATSSEYLLFEERGRFSPTHAERIRGRFTIVNRAMEAVGHFSIGVDCDEPTRQPWGCGPSAVFSPDGQTIALSAGDTVYLVPVATAQPAVLFKAEATGDQVGVWLDWRYGGPHIRIIAAYETASGDRRREQHDFSWTGAPPPGAACQGSIVPRYFRDSVRISPDGRYVASLVGGHVFATNAWVTFRADPWPSVVITDAATCAPLFRVRSAHTYELVWDAAWLPSSDGFVIGVRDGYMILQVRPTPDLVRLPGRGARLANPAGGAGGGEATNRRAGPEPAPTGDGRHFGYGPNVYDAREDRWLGPAFVGDGRFGWGDSHRDRWFTITPYWGEGRLTWLQLPPVIEFPPFSDVIAFRVAGTESCLRLRAAPGLASEIKGCLPDGARLVLTEPTEPPPDRAGCYGPPSRPHPAVAWSCPLGAPPTTWVHVRTEQGAEGWVSHDYLEHDIARCQPRAPADGRSNDAADLGLEDCGLPPTTLTYGAPVTTGSVTDDGDYAFLTDPDDLTTLVTTYEGLRDGSTTGLVIHKNDSGGTSQADFYALVEAGDIVEWRQASDCFVRYTVTDVKDDPAGDPPRKLLAVAWMTYAFTGCTGALSPTTPAILQFGPLPALGGTSLTAPVIHGIYQLVPEDWSGTTEAGQGHHPPGVPAGPFIGLQGTETRDLAEAREHPYWREPAGLFAGDTFQLAITGGYDATPIGYCAAYGSDGLTGIVICGDYAFDRRFPAEASWVTSEVDPSDRRRGVVETRVIAGRPARVQYSPPGPNHSSTMPTQVLIYDSATQTEYEIFPYDTRLQGANIDAVIAIARSLFEPPNAP